MPQALLALLLGVFLCSSASAAIPTEYPTSIWLNVTAQGDGAQPVKMTWGNGVATWSGGGEAYYGVLADGVTQCRYGVDFGTWRLYFYDLTTGHYASAFVVAPFDGVHFYPFSTWSGNWVPDAASMSLAEPDCGLVFLRPAECFEGIALGFGLALCVDAATVPFWLVTRLVRRVFVTSIPKGAAS